MAQGPNDTILVAIRITLRIRESKVRNPDPPDSRVRRRFVLSGRILVLVRPNFNSSLCSVFSHSTVLNLKAFTVSHLTS